MDPSETFQSLAEKVADWGRALVLLLPNLGVALLVIFAAWLAARGASSAMRRVTKRASGHQALADLVARIAYAGIWIAGFVIALRVLDLDDAAAAALAGAGIVGLALGFAFQDLTANFIAGVALALKRPMSPGEIVETNGHRGIVQSIELRSTVLRTFAGQIVRIPNRKIFEEPLINESSIGMRRVDLTVGISYGDDLEKVRRVVLEAVSGVSPRDASREVELFYEQFGESSIDFQVRFWISFEEELEYLRARSEAVIAIKKAFDANDITIPFPIRTLDFGIKGGETLEEMLSKTTVTTRANGSSRDASR
ncbi:MAG: mechanosensitive ion channel family protein [Myxococcota bacterium]|nr:mechanosensitive ion channel family protein [Myxococcota bacterium]